jgi:hypothetical protein
MEQKNDSMRERLLARLPQPENIAAYREETASLMAKHERALFWEKMPSTVLLILAVGSFWLACSSWGQKFDIRGTHSLYIDAGIFFFVGSMIELRYNIYRNRVELLKEVKQVQLQVLELQASLNKSRDQKL